MGIFQHLRRDENLTAEAAWKEGTFITGECSICSSVLPLSSSAARDLHALEWLGTGGSTLTPLPLSWPKVSTSVIFTEPGFAARCALGFSRMLIINWKYSSSFRMLGYSEIIWRGFTVCAIQTWL